MVEPALEPSSYACAITIMKLSAVIIVLRPPNQIKYTVLCHERGRTVGLNVSGQNETVSLALGRVARQ